MRTADFSIAGEKVAGMPFQAIADTGSFTTVPSSCSAGGGVDIATVNAFGANGILGVGTTTTDCGSYCTTDGGSSAAIYYDCPPTGCSAIVGRASNAAAPFQQLPNPVAAFPADNNGVILSLPSVAQAGVPTLTGTVTFGIGTQADNTLTAANVLPVTTSSSRLGPGVLTVAYTAGANAEQLTQSFLDSGSSDYFFIDTSLNPCTENDLIAFYCPTSPMPLSPVLTATDGTTASGAFTLYSPLSVADTSNVAPGLGLNPTLVTPPLPFANSFDFGLPFFFGRTVYTAIEGRAAGSVQGPLLRFLMRSPKGFPWSLARPQTFGCPKIPIAIAALGRRWTKLEVSMYEAYDLELSRRGLLAAGAGSVAVSAAPAVSARPAQPQPSTAHVTFEVNGERRTLELDTRTTLLDALREHLHLTGSKKGCDHGQCGACTVIVDGRRINSCLTLAVMHEGSKVTTIEGLGSPERLHPMQAAFVKHDRLPVRLLHAGPDLLGLWRCWTRSTPEYRATSAPT